MPPPPPPPPPAPPPPPGPPPLPAFGGNNHGPNSGSGGTSKPPDRNALLGEIRGGAQLKKTKTNDRSQPAIDGRSKPQSNSSEGFMKSSETRSNNGPSAGPMGLGGLFAQGMPKLKPAGSRVAPTAGGIQASNLHKTTSSNHGYQPPTPSASVTMRNGSTPNHNAPGGHHFNGTSSPKERAPSFGASSQNHRPSFPNDINSSSSPGGSTAARGPPPPPPLASQKPQLHPISNPTLTFTPASNNQDNRPPPPSKPPGVTRSSSQTSLNGKVGMGSMRMAPHHKQPPTTKPPPPPKMHAVGGGPGGVPPALPSKPPNLSRRKSFGGPDLRNGILAQHSQQQQHQSPSMQRPFHAPFAKIGGPPPPPRNISVPDSLNQMHHQSLNSNNYEPPPPLGATVPPSSGLPPPPPPPPASAKHQGLGGGHQGLVPGRSMPNLAPAPPLKPPNVRPPPPPSRGGVAPPPPTMAPPAAPPPPPPPHHRVAYPGGGAPPSSSAMKAVAPQPPMHQNMNNNYNAPPPPPARYMSTLSRNSGGDIDDFEAKFFDRFLPIESLPRPPPFGNIQKSYPSSKVPPGQNRQRNPPPPPPSSSSSSISGAALVCNSNQQQPPYRQPLLHIQLDSKMFDSSISQC